MRAISFFIAIILLFFFTLSYTSCKKEYSYEGGIAVFTFLAGGSNCEAPLINGVYAPSVVLTSSNTVQLQVNVTRVGKYAFVTNSANGIQFTTSGSFTTLGLQKIILTGKGKPVSQGTFSFIPDINAGCAFFITVQTGLPEFARYTLIGSPVTCSNFKVNGIYTEGVILTGDNTVEVTVDVSVTGSYTLSTDTLNGLYFSAARSFTSTGVQKIVLQGSGIPSIADKLIFNVNTGSSICSFDLIVVTAGPPATYVLESNNDGSCTGYSVSGNYFKGEALTSTNTMAIKITVTVKGSYTINTDYVNGMRFTATGTFNSLGSQIVILTGKGVPVNRGTFSFTPQIIGPHPIGGEVCTANIEVM